MKRVTLDDIACWLYDADDEEPRCDRCLNRFVSCEYCAKHCGPEHGWNEYMRPEPIEDEDRVDEN